MLERPATMLMSVSMLVPISMLLLTGICNGQLFGSSSDPGYTTKNGLGMSKPPVTDTDNVLKHIQLLSKYIFEKGIVMKLQESMIRGIVKSSFYMQEKVDRLNNNVDNITEQKLPRKSESGPTENAAMKTVERIIEEKENKTNFEDSIAKILPKVSEGGATLHSGIKSLLPVYMDSIFIDYMMIIMLGVLVAFVALGIYTFRSRSVFLWLFLLKNNKMEAMLTGILEKVMDKYNAQLQEKMDKYNAQLQEKMDKCNAHLQEKMEKLQEKIDKLVNISEKSVHREDIEKMKDALTTSVQQMSADIRQSFHSSNSQETYTGSDFVETKSTVKTYPCVLM